MNRLQTVGYIRKSTDISAVQKDRAAIQQLSSQKGFGNVRFVEEEMASLNLDWRQREIGRLLDMLNTNDRLLIVEFFTIGKTGMESIEIMRHIQKKGIQVIAVRGGWEMSGLMKFPSGG